MSDEKDPHYHVPRVRRQMEELIEHLRRDIELVQEPEARTLFDATLRVLEGLATAYRCYEEKEEAVPETKEESVESGEESDYIGASTDGAPD